MKCNDLEVHIGDGDIILVQERNGKDPEYVKISPDQAELICSWIMGAKKALRSDDVNTTGAI